MKTDDFNGCVNMCKTISNCKVATWFAHSKMCYTKFAINQSSKKICGRPMATNGRECSLVPECRD